MSRYSSTSKVARCGAVDSKYFGATDKFEKDVQAKIDKTSNLKFIQGASEENKYNKSMSELEKKLLGWD